MANPNFSGMARVGVIVTVMSVSWSALAATGNGITTISNPGGGTIAYAQLPAQHTAQGAMGKVLQYVNSNFGARPDVDKVMKSPDGNSLAVTFTVTPAKSGSGQIAGLAMVSVSASGPGAGAVLSDTADRFRTTLKPMLQKLQAEANAKGGSAGAQAAIASASQSTQSPGTPAPASKTTASAAKTSAPPTSASTGPVAPAAPLHQTPLPDGSGTIGLPDGWKITSAHAGDVIAAGPQGEHLRFGMAQSVLDPGNPQSRALGRGPGGTAPGNFVSIPIGTPGDVAFKSMLTQLSQKQRKTPPQMDFKTVQELPNGGQPGHSYFLSGNVNAGEGPAVTWVQLFTSGPLAMGGWQMTIYEVTVPEALAPKEAATVGAMFHSYKANNAAIQGEINADTQMVNKIFANAQSNIQQITDSSNRSTQAMSDYLRGNTVISDSYLNGHGRVSDDVASALIAADPNRFQAVSSSAYVQGIDY